MAEMVIAMLIIMLTVIMIGPNIVKNKTKGKKPNGYWECLLDEQNRHVSILKTENGNETKLTEGNYCTFKPQPNAEEYLVTVVGGGGGGASGTSLSYDAISFGDPVGFRVETKGTYDIILIGGGGAGSAAIGETYGQIGGSAGEVKILENRELKTGYYVLKAGQGGRAGGLEKEENEETNEEDETDIAEACKPKYTGDTSWKKICDGGSGGDSMLYNQTRTVNYKARGGYGGGSLVMLKSSESDGLSTTDKGGCSSRAGKRSSGGYISDETDTCKKALNSLSINANYIGRGGDGSASEIAYPGYNGVALVRSSLFYSGGGGKTGGISFTAIKDIKSPVKVIVGKGGEGATVENAAGKPGENSSFGYYLTAKGGDGGEIRAQSNTSEMTKLDGEAGQASPYGDKLYAQGGNGGWAYSAKNSTVTDKWGKGENGYPGYVRVEWN